VNHLEKAETALRSLAAKSEDYRISDFSKVELHGTLAIGSALTRIADSLDVLRATRGFEGKLLLREREVVEALGISRTVVWKLVKDGDLETVKIGDKTTRFTVEGLRAYVERLSA